jgi:hypothetical protein
MTTTLPAYQWHPMDTVQLGACSEWWRCKSSDNLVVEVVPYIIEARTTRGKVVRAYYQAHGDYEDRWTDKSGRTVYKLTHWRPIRA